jgi:glycosyltransferase involved in cell wall biosynthesis
VRIIPGIDRQRLVELYRLAYAVVYPSIAENCPFALLESMAMGLPIAAARIGAITETCGEAAIYFDPADPTEITSQMARLLDDQHLCDKLRLHSITRAAGFDWDQSAGRTIDLFSRIIARPGNQRKRV